MRRLFFLPLVLYVLAALLSGCRQADTAPRLSTAIHQVVSGKPLIGGPEVWKDVREFYKQRNDKPAWVDDEYPLERAGEALQVLNAAGQHGFAPEDYGTSQVVQLHAAFEHMNKDAPDHVQRLAEFDARLTAALLALGHDVALGRTRPTAIDGRWKARRKAPDFAGTFVNAVDGDLTHWLDQVRPQHPEYVALQKALIDLRGQEEKGGWPKVPAGPYTLGKSNRGVVALRQRLAASGALEEDASTTNSPAFDHQVQAGVKAFQDLHGIKATGVVDRSTLDAMNVPIEARIRQVALNMERWRWMPDDLGSRHLFVNIPYFHLIARENGRPVMDIRVVVGKRGNETPIFSDDMETVVFSPYWNIPDSIKQGETAPAVARDPEYLQRNNIEILRVSKGGAHRVDPSTVNWNDPAELRELAFRQRPGDSNALGHVKFLFPNDFDVYLHDTPADSLFQRTGRAFSHGCIRVEEPEVLANYVLRDAPEWDGARILRAMHSGDEQPVKLKSPLPVHITYFTAWVDENGGLHFQPDIYGYDAKQASELPRPGSAIAE